MSTTTRTRDAFKIEHHPLTALRPPTPRTSAKPPSRPTTWSPR